MSPLLSWLLILFILAVGGAWILWQRKWRRLTVPVSWGPFGNIGKKGEAMFAITFLTDQHCLVTVADFGKDDSGKDVPIGDVSVELDPGSEAIITTTQQSQHVFEFRSSTPTGLFSGRLHIDGDPGPEVFDIVEEFSGEVKSRVATSVSVTAGAPENN